jgi:hypothetical protein
MTMVLPSCAFAECLLAAVATILDKLTAAKELAFPPLLYVVTENLTRAVDLGHHEPSEDDLVELGVGAACYFAVSYHHPITSRFTYEPRTCRGAPTASRRGW